MSWEDEPDDEYANEKEGREDRETRLPRLTSLGELHAFVRGTRLEGLDSG